MLVGWLKFILAPKYGKRYYLSVMLKPQMGISDDPKSGRKL